MTSVFSAENKGSGSTACIAPVIVIRVFLDSLLRFLISEGFRGEHLYSGYWSACFDFSASAKTSYLDLTSSDSLRHMLEMMVAAHSQNVCCRVERAMFLQILLVCIPGLSAKTAACFS